jgi:hypothetical protein
VPPLFVAAPAGIKDQPQINADTQINPVPGRLKVHSSTYENLNVVELKAAARISCMDFV